MFAQGEFRIQCHSKILMFSAGDVSHPVTDTLAMRTSDFDGLSAKFSSWAPERSYILSGTSPKYQLPDVRHREDSALYKDSGNKE